MRGLWVLGLLAAAAQGQEAARVSYRFERLGVGLETPRYSLEVGEDGRAKYHAELAAPKGAGAEDAQAPGIDKEVTISAATTAKIFELARAADRFRVECASKAKGIADTGKKTLRYVGADGTGECSYNYSDVKPVVAETEIFQRIEATLESGRRMDFKRRFDRLGLDAEMMTLGSMLDGGQASDLETIVPTLRAIAGDTELLERVRTRADKMLQKADAER